jgi:hypothetical protein
MSSSASPAITEATGVKDQGGPPTNSGPVAIASGIPAVMSGSPAVLGLFGSPEDDDIMVVDRGSKRGRTGRKVTTVWEYFTNDIKPNTLPVVTCQHCMRTMSTGRRSERAVLYVNSCPSFKFTVVDIDDEGYPDWVAASTPKKSAAGRATFVSVSRRIDSRMVPRTQTSIAKFTVPRLSKATQLKINSSIAMHYNMTGTSFARIEDPHLLKAFQLCRPDVKLPTRKELACSLLNLMETIAGGADGPTAFSRVLLCYLPYPTGSLPDHFEKDRDGAATRPRGCATHRRSRSVCKSSRKT